jgi:Ca2+-binding EF-hand superfamily protein
MNRRNSRLIFAIVAAVVFALVPAGTAQERRSGWDPATFLQRLDRNGNGSLEPDEMVGRAQGFVDKLGLDTSRPVAIEAIMDAINRQREDAANEERKKAAAQSPAGEWSTPRLVPGFGEDVKLPTVLGFGEAATAAPESESASTGNPDEVSESVRAQVDRVLNQYDPNKDGVLDANEIKNTPWGAPPPQESDTNGDGRLTRSELIERYRKREADSVRFNGPRDDNSRGRRDAGPTPAPAVAPARLDSRPADQPARTAASRSASAESRIADYVQNLLKQYDSDNDGSISAEEQSKMKSSPKGADADSDGKLSRDELTAYYGGGYKSGAAGRASNSATLAAENSADGTAKSAGSGNSQDRARRRENRGRAESARGSAGPEGQRPVKMHEFASEWTAEKLAEFRRLDANRDGVISVDEFQKRD